VLNRCEFLERYHGGVCFEPERVGDVVVIASGARFPGAMPAALYEHGGPSREEIMSFVGIVGKSSGAGLSFS
jgi:hypothetical protein